MRALLRGCLRRFIICFYALPHDNYTRCLCDVALLVLLCCYMFMMLWRAMPMLDAARLIRAARDTRICLITPCLSPAAPSGLLMP